MNTQYDNLLSAIHEAEISYREVDFPIFHKDDGVFVSKNGVEFRFSLDGAGYLSERNTRYKFAEFTKLVREARWVDLAILANDAIIPTRGSGQKLLFAMFGEYCVGVLRHYNMVKHEELLMAIKEAGLSDDLRNWEVNSLYMACDVVTRTHGSLDDDDQLTLGLRIINGHSGHHALQYKLLVKANAYEFTAPSYGRSRHMTGVSVMVENLRSALGEVATAKIDGRLKSMTSWEILNLITSKSKTRTARQDALLHLVENSDVETGLDVVVILGQYASTKGYATAVKNLLDPVMKSILEKK